MISRRRGTMGGGFGAVLWPALQYAWRFWSFFIGRFCWRSAGRLCSVMLRKKI
jgi:hypothetical protein